MKDNFQLRPYQVPVQSPPDPRYQIQLTTDRFLLALQNRAPEQLESLLTLDATVREHASASGSPALPALLALSHGWSDPAGQNTLGSASSVPPLGPFRVVDLLTQGSEGWATVEVGGPPKLKGLWKLHLTGADKTPQVAEVILPKSR